MRVLASLLLPLLVLAGCGPSASIQRVSSDLSGQDPILQVWCHAKRLDEGADIKVAVGWNHWLGTGPVHPNELRADGTVVVNVNQWSHGSSDYDRVNEMKVEFTYDGKVLAKRVVPTPTDFANAFNKTK